MGEPELYWYKALVTRVIDGDTFEVFIDLGFRTSVIRRVRLAGVNTPETYGVKKESEEYKKGKAATAFATDWLFERENKVYLRTEKLQGKYGRYIAHVWDKDRTESLGEKMVELGFAERVDY